MNNIIDNPLDLVKLNYEQLNELLLNEKYNKANLRELVRRIIKELSDQLEYNQYLKKKLEDFER